VDLRRLSPGDWIAAVAGVVMLVALFLPWYSSGNEDLNAWQSMAVDDVILAVVALLAIAAAVFVGLRRFTSLSVAVTSLAILPAVCGLVVTTYRLISPAPPGEVSLGVGAWLALAATVAIALGACAGAVDEGPSRRSPEAERQVADDAIATTEVVKLPPDGPEPARG
jgi:hypothetical protein